MTGLQNLHSHTLYCDGSLKPEEMIKAAIEKGCLSFGFSGHSYAPHDTETCMSVEDTPLYMEEVRQLQAAYKSDIEIFLGIEQEYYADTLPKDVDFIIGSVHYIKKSDKMLCVDESEQILTQGANECYGGDYYAMAEDYYETIAGVIEKTNADIVGHFDIFAKFNFEGRLFDETHPRYVGAALSAMDEILKGHKLFEVNTNAMYKYGKPEPYPSVFLIKELYRRGGEVILSSDSHNAESICYKFAEMRELLKSCGFKYIKRLTDKGFVDVRI